MRIGVISKTSSVTYIVIIEVIAAKNTVFVVEGHYYLPVRYGALSDGFYIPGVCSRQKIKVEC